MFIYSIDFTKFDGSITNWTTLSAMISSFSIVILIITVVEMIKQRRESYRPRLLVKTENIQIENDNRNIPIVWRDPQNRDICTSGYYNLKMYNAGLGAATNIEITWAYPKQKIIRDIGKIAPHILNGLTLKFETAQGWIEYEMFQKDELYIRKEAFLKSEDFFYFAIPASIFYYYSIITYFLSKNNHFGYSIPFDSMRIDISYKDIGNKKIRDSFFIKPELTSMLNKEGQSNSKLIAIGDIHMER